MACGTGLVAIPLLLQGIPLTGVDNVPGMSGLAKRKSEKPGLSVRWIQGDTRTSDLKENFNFIYMTGSAFQAFLSNADQVAMPGQVRKHLADDGVWTIETRNPNRVDCSTDLNGTERMTYTNDKGLSVQIMETREYDHAAQVLVYNLYRRWKANGKDKEYLTHIAIRHT